jgi:hypothetical protein
LEFKQYLNGEHMKKLVITGVAVASMFTMQFAHSATICDMKAALGDARSNLVDMVASTDKAEQEGLKGKVDAATTELEAATSAMLGDDNKDDDADLATFEKTWADFKDTREAEIVPAVYAGDNAKAKEIATGIQAERMSVMNGVLSSHGGDDCK